MELLNLDELLNQLSLTKEAFDANSQQIMKLENTLRDSKINLPYSIEYKEEELNDGRVERRDIAWGYYEKQSQYRLLIVCTIFTPTALHGNIVDSTLPIDIAMRPLIEAKLAVRADAIINFQKFADGFAEFLKTTRVKLSKA